MIRETAVLPASFSLLKIDETGCCMSMHPLVHVWARDRLSRDLQGHSLDLSYFNSICRCISGIKVWPTTAFLSHCSLRSSLAQTFTEIVHSTIVSKSIIMFSQRQDLKWCIKKIIRWEAYTWIIPYQINLQISSESGHRYWRLEKKSSQDKAKGVGVRTSHWNEWDWSDSHHYLKCWQEKTSRNPPNEKRFH